MKMETTLHEEIINFTQELIRIKSLSGEEGALAQAVENKLRSMDFDEVFVDEYGSVVATRAGKRQGSRVLFDAHMDVVPVQNPKSWSVDPFGGELRDRKIWGRGATDIKGGLAGMVITLGRLPREVFCGTLILSASVGEELIEGAALQRVVESTHPDGAVIIEPTQCHLGIGQKGRTGFWIKVRGKPAHTSNPEIGENAVYKAVAVIQRLRDLPLPVDPFLGKGVMELIEICSTPFPGECTVPYECLLRFDRRLVDGESQDTIRSAVENTLASLKDWEMGFNNTIFKTYTGQLVKQLEFHPGWMIEPTSIWVKKASESLKSANLDQEYIKVPYCTNGSCTAGILQLPTVIFGPSTVELAHVIDEYIEVDELLRGAGGLAHLAIKLGKKTSTG